MSFNNLHSKIECPICHTYFISGFDDQNIRKCPSCKNRFIAASTVNPVNANQRIQNNTNNQGIQGMDNMWYGDNCPAIMSDGRFITYHNSSNELTESMRKMNNIKSSNQFRNFMQNNGQQIMDAERQYHTSENTCQSTRACSQGWYDLWKKNNGSWANN